MAMDYAGIVDEYVEPTPTAHGLVDQVVSETGLADIAREELRPGTASRPHALAPLDGTAGQHQARAGHSRCLGDGFANAGGGTRDNDHLVLELHWLHTPGYLNQHQAGAVIRTILTHRFVEGYFSAPLICPLPVVAFFSQTSLGNRAASARRDGEQW